jgi:hypothetical protein
MATPPQAPLIAFVERFAPNLRFPYLFLLMLVLFLLDLGFPDFIPFVDEILLALGTVLLGAWKKSDRPEPPPPTVD